jgi:hypothetical protein
MRIVGTSRFLATCAEVTAPPAGVERDALAVSCILARLLARREVGDLARRLAQVELALGHVALVPVKVGWGGSCIFFHSLGVRIVGRLLFVTRCAEVAAPPGLPERDALARYFILARLLARLVVFDFA